MALKTTQTATNSSDAELIAESALGRRSMVVKNPDTSNAMYLGGTSDVTSSTGFPLAAGESVTLVAFTADLYAIAGAGTPTACVLEVVEDRN